MHFHSRIFSSGTSRGPAVDVFNFGGGRSQTCRQHPQGGPAIDIFNFGGGRCRTYRQHPPGSPPSTSSTSMVVAVELVASTPQGAHYRRLRHRWWLLPDMLPAPARGALWTSSTFLVATVGPAVSTPQGVPSTSSPLVGPLPPSMFLSVDGGRSQIFSSNWPHLWVRSLSRGGLEGLCQYLRPGTPAYKL
jgi:hypothetical protein